MRLLNRLLAALLSLALVVAGVLVVIEVVAERLDRGPAIVDWPRLHDWARRTPWQQGSVRTACILLALAGLLLLVAELRRGRPSRLAVRSEVTDAAYTRRGVAAAIRSAVGEVDGITAATVSVSRRRVSVEASTAGLQPHTAESLREPATAAARHRLEALELAEPPALSVRVSTAAPGGS
ncbi:MAG: alkaline shock response membrane anchor protein AmaP [Actinobacteria bacterium]|nr:alkaline shock response membrane anchor protein AmaP [Actinomycetota bacterium]